MNDDTDHEDGAARGRRRANWRWIAIGGGVVAVVVAVIGGVSLAGKRGTPQEAPPTEAPATVSARDLRPSAPVEPSEWINTWSIEVPDVAHQPELGPELNSLAILGDVGVSEFGPLIGEDSIAVIGGPQPPDPIGLHSGGSGPALLASVDLGTGETNWTVDLAAAAGFDHAYVACRGADLGWWGSAGIIAGGGATDLVVQVGDAPQRLHEDVERTDHCVTMGINSAGEVVQRLETTGGMLDSSGGVAIFANGGRIEGRDASDFTRVLWSAPFGSPPQWYSAVSPTLRNEPGTFWALTKRGYVEAATGEPVGFGEDAFTDGLTYLLRDDGVLLRSEYTVVPDDDGGVVPDIFQEGMGYDIMRVDPATGKDLWPHALLVNDFDSSWAQSHDGLVPFRLNQTVILVDPATGVIRETVPVEPYAMDVNVAADRYALVPATADFAHEEPWVLSVFDMDDGHKVLSVPTLVPMGVTTYSYGQEFVYACQGESVEAYALAGGSRVWSVPVSANHLYRVGDRLFAQNWTYGGDLDTPDFSVMRELVW